MAEYTEHPDGFREATYGSSPRATHATAYGAWGVSRVMLRDRVNSLRAMALGCAIRNCSLMSTAVLAGLQGPCRELLFHEIHATGNMTPALFAMFMESREDQTGHNEDWTPQGPVTLTGPRLLRSARPLSRLVDSLACLTSPSPFKWVTDVTLAHLVLAPGEIMALKNLHNLRALRIHGTCNSISGLRPKHDSEFTINDFWWRAMSQQTATGPCFHHLEVVVIQGQSELTPACLDHLNGFPRLRLFAVCPVVAVDHASAMDWMTYAFSDDSWRVESKPTAWMPADTGFVPSSRWLTTLADWNSSRGFPAFDLPGWATVPEGRREPCVHMELNGFTSEDRADISTYVRPALVKTENMAMRNGYDSNWLMFVCAKPGKYGRHLPKPDGIASNKRSASSTPLRRFKSRMQDSKSLLSDLM